MSKTKADLLKEIKKLEKEVQGLEEEQGECPNCDGFEGCPECEENDQMRQSLEEDNNELCDRVQELEDRIEELENEQIDIEELASVSSDLADLQYKIDALI